MNIQSKQMATINVWMVVLAFVLGVAACSEDENGDNDKDEEDSTDAMNNGDTGLDDTGAESDTGDTTDITESETDEQADENPATAFGADDLQDCESGDEVPCKTFFSSALESPITLGPYGSIMEANVGEEFSTGVALMDQIDVSCDLFTATFNQDPELSAEFLDTQDLDLSLFTVYRPVLWKDGEKFPVITWGNGTCAQPDSYGTLLRYVASHGFIIVAANTRWVGQNAAQRKGLEFMFAANEDPNSIYYQRIDTDKVGAMGHSQGSMATGTVARNYDPIKAIILFNGGNTAAKPYLAVSGERDITATTPQGMGNAVNNSAQPAAFLFYHKIPQTGSMDGHLTLMLQPERVMDPTVHWFRYMLSDDTESREWFIGDNCELCNQNEDFEYGHNALL